MRKSIVTILGCFGMLYSFSSWSSPIAIDFDFRLVRAPDSVVVNGLEWAQLDIFESVSWNDLNAVCPSMADGKCDGILEDVQLTDWVWASVDDVNSLFNFFLSDAGISGPDLLNGPNSYTGKHLSEWAPAFFDAGFRTSSDISRFITGPLRDLDSNGAPRSVFLKDTQQGRSGDVVHTDFPLFDFGTPLEDRDGDYRGAWLFRASEVPVSSTLFLSLAALLGLAMSRTKKGWLIDNGDRFILSGTFRRQTG